MTTLEIHDIECHAYHGCLPEETKIGGRFSVDVILAGDFRKAMTSDDLTDAADYVTVHNIVREEMAIPSKLIEHVAGRIMNRLTEVFSIKSISVRIKKFNPPVNGKVGYALFEVTS